MPDLPPPSWPYYELPSTELAAWVQRQPDMWWNVDGDPLLTGLVLFPCLSDRLAEEFRRLDRPLLVRTESPDAVGRPIGRDEIDGLTAWFFGSHYPTGDLRPPEDNDRFLELRWKDRPAEWLLIEDGLTVAEERAEADRADGASTPR